MNIKTMIHQPPKVRPATCEKHGAFEAKCHLSDIWTKCPHCAQDERQAAEALEQARKRDQTLREWQARIGQSGIPERFHERTLDTFVAGSDAQRYALTFAKAFADNFEQVIKTGRSAMFIGKPGTGKTHLAAGIGLQIMREQRRSVLFTTVMRAVRRVKDSWSRDNPENEGKAIASMVFPDLLILDEVGVQFGSEFEKNILFDVLNERYEKRRPVLLLSNLHKDDVTGYLGERIVDRLREDGGKLIPFTWESHRGK
ncbi:MAG: ATP-binding protein [Aestuariivirga sp.]